MLLCIMLNVINMRNDIYCLKITKFKIQNYFLLYFINAITKTYTHNNRENIYIGTYCIIDMVHRNIYITLFTYTVYLYIYTI